MNPPTPSLATFPAPNSKQSNAAISLAVPPELVELVAERAAELVAERQAAAEPVLPYLTVSEAADYLRCRPKRIYDLTGQRRLAYTKDGSRTLLRRIDLDAYLKGSA